MNTEDNKRIVEEFRIKAIGMQEDYGLQRDWLLTILEDKDAQIEAARKEER